MVAYDVFTEKKYPYTALDGTCQIESANSLQSSQKTLAMSGVEVNGTPC